MFKCEILGTLSQPGEKMQKLVIQTRSKRYMEWVFNEEARKSEFVEVGEGFETVKELRVSEAGLSRWSEMTPEHKARFEK